MSCSEFMRQMFLKTLRSPCSHPVGVGRTVKGIFIPKSPRKIFCTVSASILLGLQMLRLTVIFFFLCSGLLASLSLFCSPPLPYSDMTHVEPFRAPILFPVFSILFSSL